MNHESVNPVPIKHKFFTPGVLILVVIALNGIVFLMGRFFFGLGAVTNLSNQYPWGLWNGSSALFEVGICVMIYMSVLYIEFLPIVTERFIGKVNLPGFLSGLNKYVDKILRLLDRGLSKTMFIFIIAGVVLSTLHQSSLGTLMVIP